MYFFECNDAPFTVLGDNRLCKWEDGFLEEYDLGKQAKSGSKGRSVLFERALHVAQSENGRPIELRMDWNHQGMQGQPKIPKAKVQSSSGSVGDSQQPPAKKQKSIGGGSSKSLNRVSSSSSITGLGVTTQQLSRTINRKNMNSTINSLSNHDVATAIEPLEDGPLVCKILRKLPLGVISTSTVEGMEFSNNVGFITLRSRQSATFADIRKAVESELDSDCFQDNGQKVSGRNEKVSDVKWKFYVPKLGPVSVKQEEKIGPVLEFLKSTTNDSQLGNGTASSPLKVVIIDL